MRWTRLRMNGHSGKPNPLLAVSEELLSHAQASKPTRREVKKTHNKAPRRDIWRDGQLAIFMFVRSRAEVYDGIRRTPAGPGGGAEPSSN